MTATASQPAVLLERDGGLAILTLNRPEAYNALDMALMQALLDALVACDQDRDVRAVLLTGAGSAFCSGGDIKAMQRHDGEPGGASHFLGTLTVPFHGAVATIARMPKPVVAAVNGPAAGGGFSLALACDLLVAAESATFLVAYARLGVSPDGSCTYFLPRLVGPKAALSLYASNRPFDAKEAQAMGIVDQVYPAASFADDARAYGARLAAGPTEALGRAKCLFGLSMQESLETQMEYERRGLAASAGTADFREGVAAFVERREPVFEGR